MEQSQRLPSRSTVAVLTRVLHRFGISENEYSIGSPAEQRVCMENVNGKYHVYLMERGIKFDESYHETELDAHLEILHQLASTNDEYHAMSSAYMQRIRNLSDPIVHTGHQMLNTNIVLAKNKKGQLLEEVFVGDPVRVHVRTGEGTQERVQIFEGTIVARESGPSGKTITVRRIANGIGVKKVFPLSSPAITSIEVIRTPKMQRRKKGSPVHLLSGKTYKRKMKL